MDKVERTLRIRISQDELIALEAMAAKYASSLQELTEGMLGLLGTHPHLLQLFVDISACEDFGTPA